ncbi:hypothetical protein FJZ40_03040 [Candidatus Shapirobacteria bacterium]|nr:hypothetical protein [Candidatus Shapirobacteria bacterium]
MQKAKLRVFLVLLALLALFAIFPSVNSTLAASRTLNFGVAPVSGTPSPAATPSPEPVVDYPLVYPGILPDHFLYPLKMVRDRVWLILTAGPLRKAEVMLLFADKRLGAAKALIEGGQAQLGVSTLTKAEKYLEQAIAKLEEAKKARADVSGQKERFVRALAKHEEVLLELKEKTQGKERVMIEELLAKIGLWKKELDIL